MREVGFVNIFRKVLLIFNYTAPARLVWHTKVYKMCTIPEWLEKFQVQRRYNWIQLQLTRRINNLGRSNMIIGMGMNTMNSLKEIY